MKIKVLGAAAGGGFPQWNCNCPNCRRSRSGDPAAKPQTQSSLAVGTDAGDWFLLNASPDIREQIAANSELHPQGDGRRHSPIAGVVLTNADVDHVGGLLTLRESQAFTLYATRRVHGVIDANSVFSILNPDFVAKETLTLRREIDLVRPGAEPSGLTVEAFAVPGKVALYLEDEGSPDFGSVPEDTVGLRVTERATGKHFYYLPGCSDLPAPLAERIDGAPLVFFDGTTWIDDEMQATGVGHKTGKRMGHMSMAGPDGTLAAFAPLDIERKVFVHINNTNPVLLADSPERVSVQAAGWEIGYDGMGIEL